MASQHPQIGFWYVDPQDDSLFEIVAIDENFGTIEIQFDNGDIDELEFEQWDNNQYLASSSPNDPAAAYGMTSDDSWDDDFAEDMNYLERDTGKLDLDSYPDFDDLI